MNGQQLRSAEQPALDPVRERTLARARADAQAVLDEARAEAQAALESARARAEDLLEQARAQGTERARAEAAGTRNAARAQARAEELGAERAVYDAVCRGITERIGGLLDAPQYPQIRAELDRRARELLGPQALISPAQEGGVIATVPGRRVDLSLPAIAARVIEGLGEKAARLWTG